MKYRKNKPEPSQWEQPAEYRKLGATVDKWRSHALVSELTREERQLYGAAVLKAVRAKQRAALLNR